MSTSVEPVRPSLVTRLADFSRDVVAEMKKVTWPDKEQVRQMTIQILVFVLVIGAIIALMDLVMQLVLVRLPASLR